MKASVRKWHEKAYAEGVVTKEETEAEDLTTLEGDLDHIRDIQARIELGNKPHPDEGVGCNTENTEPTEEEEEEPTEEDSLQNLSAADLQAALEDVMSMKRLADPDNFTGLHRIQISLSNKGILPFRDIHYASKPHEKLDANFFHQLSFTKNAETPDLAPDMAFLTVTAWVPRDRSHTSGAKILGRELVRSKVVPITLPNIRNAICKVAENAIDVLDTLFVDEEGKEWEGELNCYGVGHLADFGPVQYARALDEARGMLGDDDDDDDDHSVHSGLVDDTPIVFKTNDKMYNVPSSEDCPTNTAPSEQQDELQEFLADCADSKHSYYTAEEVTPPPTTV